jgi:AcrR family transcriptional regulator
MARSEDALPRAAAVSQAGAVSHARGGADGVRERILAAAVDLFAAQGYDATSVSQVVAQAGVTKGALYHYFTAKDDLLFEIYHTLLSDQLSSLDRIMGLGLDPASTLREIIRSLVETTAGESKAVTVFSREGSKLTEERWETFRTDWRRYQDTVRALIRDAQADGAFAGHASPEIISWAIFGVSNSMPTWFRPDGPKKPPEIAEELADFVLAALTPAPTPRRES